MTDLRAILRKRFGFSTFRPHQKEIVEAFSAGKDVFAALPTGGGKSLCYQLPAVAGTGLTLVVSPLIALMQDQVEAARVGGIPAACMNSTLTPEQTGTVFRDIRAGQVSLLYVSPERLALDRFREDLNELNLQRIAIDEAHCISEWGHEFRPDYRTLGTLRTQFASVPIAAFTATATEAVQDDVIRQLRLREPLVVRASFDRAEIFYRVERKAQVNKQITQFVLAHPDESGIVYRSTRAATEETARVLVAHGVSAVAYHAGLPWELRRTRQAEFVHDDVSVVVATIAFGMGIDKSNVRWVIHGDLPKSLESYYQETGRAARDGEPAETVLFAGSQDTATIRRHIDKIGDDAERQRAEARLGEMLRYTQGNECRRKRLLGHFNEEHAGDCGACDVCCTSARTVDATVAAQKVLSAAVRTGQRFGGHYLADIVTGTHNDRIAQYGHSELPTFGVGRDRPKEFWLSIVRDAESMGLLARTDGGRSGLRVTQEGRRILNGKATFAVRVSGSSGDFAESSGGPDSSRADLPGTDELFQRLRRLRNRIARERGIPSYTIFSDKSLRVMVRNRPVDRAALLRCHGVGEYKLEMFGEDFLRAIREFLSGE